LDTYIPEWVGLSFKYLQRFTQILHSILFVRSFSCLALADYVHFGSCMGKCCAAVVSCLQNSLSSFCKLFHLNTANLGKLTFHMVNCALTYVRMVIHFSMQHW